MIVLNERLGFYFFIQMEYSCAGMTNLFYSFLAYKINGQNKTYFSIFRCLGLTFPNTLKHHEKTHSLYTLPNGSKSHIFIVQGRFLPTLLQHRKKLHFSIVQGCFTYVLKHRENSFSRRFKRDNAWILLSDCQDNLSQFLFK